MDGHESSKHLKMKMKLMWLRYSCFLSGDDDDYYYYDDELVYVVSIYQPTHLHT